MRKVKVLSTIVFTIIALFFIGVIKSDAAMWPVGGSNAKDTFIEYGYEPRTYSSQDCIDRIKNKYDVDMYEGYYYNYENHYGVDIVGNPLDTYSVVAVANGTVLGTSANFYDGYWAGVNFINRNQRRTTNGMLNAGGYGNYIAIEDESTGKCYLYAHLKAGTIAVKKGDKVVAGQKIAEMGSSGDSGHQHLHFEVRKNRYNLFTNPDGKYTSFKFKSGYGIETENPVDYIGTGSRRAYGDNKTVQLDYEDARLYVKYLYETFLNRTPADNEITYWADKYMEDKSISRITSGIALSQESYGYMGNIDNQSYINMIYLKLLCRQTEPASGEIYQTLSNMDNCIWVREDIITKICNSNEFSSSSINRILDDQKSKDVVIEDPVDNTYTDEVPSDENETEIENDYQPNPIEGMASRKDMKNYGDLNADGSVSFEDAMLALELYTSRLAQLDDNYDYVNKYADIDEDGRVTCRDAQYILRYATKATARYFDPNEVSIKDYYKDKIK